MNIWIWFIVLLYLVAGLLERLKISMAIFDLFVVLKVAQEVVPRDVLFQVGSHVRLLCLSHLVILIELNLIKHFVNCQDLLPAASHLDSIVTNEVDDGWSGTKVPD